jgi:hypothetical protein
MMTFFLVVLAFAAGMVAERRESAGRFPFEAKKPPVRRWRV